MAATLDFEALAAEIVTTALKSNASTVTIESYLKTVWNARGAADLAKLDVELSTMMGSTAAGPYVKALDRALRKLDR